MLSKSHCWVHTLFTGLSAVLFRLAGYYLTPIPRTMKLARRVAVQVVEERKRLSEEHDKGADWEGKPVRLAYRILEDI